MTSVLLLSNSIADSSISVSKVENITGKLSRYEKSWFAVNLVKFNDLLEAYCAEVIDFLS